MKQSDYIVIKYLGFMGLFLDHPLLHFRHITVLSSSPLILDKTTNKINQVLKLYYVKCEMINEQKYTSLTLQHI